MTTGIRQRGSVLLLVVMIVSLLTVVVAQLALTSGTWAVVAAADRRSLQHELALQSAVDWMLAQLSADPSVFAFQHGRRPATGIFKLTIGAANVLGIVDDESAKVSLPALCRMGRGKDAQDLLLKGISGLQHQQLAMNFAPLAAIKAQRRPGPSKQATQSQLRRLEQLVLSDRPAWPLLYARADGSSYLAKRLTVFADGPVNMLAADRQVLELALAGIDRHQRHRLLAAASTGVADGDLSAVLSQAGLSARASRTFGRILSTRSTCFSARLTSTIGQDRRELLAVIELRNNKPTVVQWCELI